MHRNVSLKSISSPIEQQPIGRHSDKAFHKEMCVTQQVTVPFFCSWIFTCFKTCVQM